MKILSFILPIYMLILGIIPCADAATPFQDNQLIKVSLIPEHSDQHQHNNGDACTPFCVCSCCQINVDQPIMTESVPCSIFAKECSETIYHKIQEPFSSIWQPPKI